MSIKRNWFYAAGISVLVLALLYGLPTFLEWQLVPSWGLVPALLFGNLIGCAIIAIFDWKRGAGLYVVLGACEWILVEGAVVGPQAVIWMADVIPAAIIAVAVLLVTGFTLDFLDVVEPRKSA